MFRSLGLALAMFASCIASTVHAEEAEPVEDAFAPAHALELAMKVEGAIASAQADYDIIPRAAADEIAAKASGEYAAPADVAKEYTIVRHQMVALLNVWRRSLSPQARDALHEGVTTVDVYDTVLVLQLLEASDAMLSDMRAQEQDMICLAAQYKDTPMIGRTLGQHALPITFGKKVAVWIAGNRRNMERLYEVRARLKTSGVLKGAVGTHVGLGPHGVEVEQRVSELLGLGPPEPADWRPARDVFAEYAQVLALIAKSNAAIGGEVFRLQETDTGEVYERRVGTAVGSSTMPHKQNPRLSGTLVYSGRTIPALASVLLDDVESIFERDNTAGSHGTLKDISIETAEMLKNSQALIRSLEPDPARMRENLNRTGGLILSQRVVLALGEVMSREEAEEKVREISIRVANEGGSFRDELLADPVVGPHLKGQIDELLNPETYLGLASVQVDRTIDWVAGKRAARGEPALQACVAEKTVD